MQKSANRLSYAQRKSLLLAKPKQLRRMTALKTNLSALRTSAVIGDNTAPAAPAADSVELNVAAVERRSSFEVISPPPPADDDDLYDNIYDV